LYFSLIPAPMSLESESPPAPLPFHTPPNPHKNTLVYRPHTISPSGKPHDLNGIGRGGVWKRRNAKSNLYQLTVGRNLLNTLIEAAYYNFIWANDCFVTPWIIIPAGGTQFVSEQENLWFNFNMHDNIRVSCTGFCR
jgi:hypothetical protein